MFRFLCFIVWNGKKHSTPKVLVKPYQGMLSMVIYYSLITFFQGSGKETRGNDSTPRNESRLLLRRVSNFPVIWARVGSIGLETEISLDGRLGSLVDKQYNLLEPITSRDESIQPWNWSPDISFNIVSSLFA